MANLFKTIGKAIGVVKSQAVASIVPNINVSMLWDERFHSIINLSNQAEITKAINECPALVYLPMKKANALCNGIVSLVDANGKVIDKDKEGYLDLLERPNFSQNRNQFLSHLYFTTQNYSFAIVLKVKPFKGLSFAESNKIESLFVLPFEEINIQWKNIKRSRYCTSYADLIENLYFENVKVDMDDVIIVTDNTYYSSSLFIPESRLKSAKDAINNLIVNAKKRGAMMNKPLGILSDSSSDSIASIGLQEDERKRLEQKFQSDYGFSKHQSDIIITRSRLSWSQMGFAINQMGFVDSEKSDLFTLCELYSFPAELLGLYGNSNVSEAKEANKRFYTGTIIPEAEHLYQQLSEGIIGDKPIKYHVDFSHVEALTIDEKEKSETRARDIVSVSLGLQNGFYTYGQACEILNITANPKWVDNYFYELPPQLIETFRLSNTGIENPNVNQNSEKK